MPDHFISRERAANDLLDCAAFLAERIKSADGHAEAMNAVIPRYLALGNVDLAAELANAVGEPFSRDKLLIAVAEKCAELDDDEYALQLAEAIEDAGMQDQALERVALIDAAKGEAARAASIAETIAHPDFIYAAIAVNQSANGDHAAAAVTLNSIQFFAARVAALQQIAAEQISDGELEKAIGSADQALAAANEIEHDEEKIRALCDIGTLYIDAKSNGKAIETFELARGSAEALENVHRDFFLVNCALGFLYAGDSSGADSTLDLVTDKTQMSSALLGFARDHWKKDEKEDAIDALDEAYEILRSQRESETRDSRSRNNLLASIAAQFAGFGKTDRATEIALENQDPEEQMAALVQIATILTVQREDGLARQTINLIAEDSNRLSALVAISDAKENLGERSEAIYLLDEAVTLAETVPQLSVRSSILNEIASRFAGYGQPEKARDISLENLTVIAEIRDESSQAASLAAIAGVYTRANLELGETEKQQMHQLVQKTGW